MSVTDCLFVADVGTVINPLALRGQLVGGVVTGLGQALMEDLTIEDGVVTTANLGDYKMPAMPDVPPIRIVLLAEHPGGGPFGAKSAGELANVAVAPAVANAVHDAIGVRITSLPITAEKVFTAMTALNAGTAQAAGNAKNAGDAQAAGNARNAGDAQGAGNAKNAGDAQGAGNARNAV